jgi:hypothetical protein
MDNDAMRLLEYIHAKSRKMQKNISPDDLNFLETPAKTNRVILLGGWHGVQQVEELFGAMVMYLNSYGYRDIILEKPVVNQYYYNMYLETGKKEYLPDFVTTNIFETLYTWNKKLDENRKIRIWCIDLDMSGIGSAIFLKDYSENMPLSIKRHITPLVEHYEQVLLNPIKQSLNQVHEHSEIISTRTGIRKIMAMLIPWIHSLSDIDTHTFMQTLKKHHTRANNKEQLELLFCIRKVIQKERKKLVERMGDIIYKRVVAALEDRITAVRINLNSRNVNAFIMEREGFLKSQFKKIYETMHDMSSVLGHLGMWHAAKSGDRIEPLGAYLNNINKETRKSVYSLSVLLYSGARCELFTGNVHQIPIIKGTFEDILAHAVDFDTFFLPLEEIFLRNCKIRDRCGIQIGSNYDSCIFIRKPSILHYSFL